MVGRDARGQKMTQNQQFAILLPLVVGPGAVVCTILVHALALVATVNFLRHERKLARRRRRLDRSRNRRGGDIIRVRGASGRNRFLGSVARALWRISRVRNRLLPLSGQLLDTGLRGSASNPLVAVAGTAGGDERCALVRCFGRDGLCCYTAVGSSLV